MKINGRVWKFGSDVDTDAIIAARYLNQSDPKELAKHVMEDERPRFSQKVRKGDILVADKNFGCGSSREHAPLALKAAGISCIMHHREKLCPNLLPEWAQPRSSPPRIRRGFGGDPGRGPGSSEPRHRRDPRPHSEEEISCKTNPGLYAGPDQGRGIDPSPSKKEVKEKRIIKFPS